MYDKKELTKEFNEYLEKERKKEDIEFERMFNNFYSFLDVYVIYFLKFQKITNKKIAPIDIWFYFTYIIYYIDFKIRKKWYKKEIGSDYSKFDYLYNELSESLKSVSDMYINKYPNKRNEIEGLDNVEIIIYFNK